jgi:ribosomal protein L33
MSKKVKNNRTVVALKGTKYNYYIKLNTKNRKTAGKEKMRLKKYNPITRKREIFRE